MVVSAPDEGGVIRDWHAVKDTNPLKSSSTYNLLIITSYGTVFEVMFDENDRG